MALKDIYTMPDSVKKLAREQLKLELDKDLPVAKSSVEPSPVPGKLAGKPSSLLYPKQVKEQLKKEEVSQPETDKVAPDRLKSWFSGLNTDQKTALIGGATPLLMGILTGATGDASTISGKFLMGQLKREQDLQDKIDFEKAKQSGEVAKPLTKANIAEVMTPEGPRYKRIEEAVGKEPYDPDRFKDLEKEAKKIKQERFKNIDTLRKARDTHHITKDTAKVTQAFDRVLSASAGKNAASDVSMVFAYMKMLDPGSVVRESEQMTGRNARGVEDALRNIDDWFREGRTLTSKQIRDFVSEAEKIYRRQLAMQERIDKPFRAQAKKMGYDEKFIFSDYRSSPKPKVNAGVEYKMYQGKVRRFRKTSAGWELLDD
jgi:hypothetical protein